MEREENGGRRPQGAAMVAACSADPAALEDWLLERLRPGRSGGLAEPALVLVSTRRLARHLARRVAERFGGALGIYIATHQELARRALEHALEAPPRLLPEGALRAAAEAMEEEAAGEDGEYLRRHRGARTALWSTLKDLREAGISPGELRAAREAGAAFPGCVVELHGRLSALLERLAAPRDCAPAGWDRPPSSTIRARGRREIVQRITRNR